MSGRGLLVVLLALPGCGRTGVLEPLEPGLDPDWRAASATATCVASDAGVPRVHHLTAWPEGCVDVGYDPAIADEVPMLEDALAAWTAPACTRICFNAPRPFAPQGRVHQVLILGWDHGALRPSDSDVQTLYSVLPGTVDTLDLINILRRPGTTATPEGYLTAVGFALGFDQTPGVSSVLNGPLGALSSADLQSVCALYPCASK